jgi:hypothetical protein
VSRATPVVEFMSVRGFRILEYLISNFSYGANMLPKHYLSALVLIASTTVWADDFVGSHYGVNLGFGYSKPFLSGFYSWDRNQINVGSGLFAATLDRGVYIAQPSITYNRYLTGKGLYASIGLLATYQTDSFTEVREQAGLPDTTWSTRKIKQADWTTPLIITGLGKNFQFTRWGIHIDASFSTELGKNFGNKIEPWIGAGLSYRFNHK